MADGECFLAGSEGTGRLVFFVPPASRLDERHDPLRQFTSLLLILNQVLHINLHGHELPLAGHLVQDQLRFADDDLVVLEGRLQTRSWEDKQTNQKKYMTEVVASDLVLLGGRGEAGGGESGHSRGASGGNNFDQRTPEPEPASATSAPISDEDIPF
jgi:hypothetical protein